MAGRLLASVGVRDKLIEEQTGGAIYLFESEFGPGEGNKLHVHRYEDEPGYVLEGHCRSDLVIKISNLARRVLHACQRTFRTLSAIPWLGGPDV